MTDQADTVVEPLFSPVELEQFDADDVVAGSAIGKMLSLLFLYTVLAMSGVVWWTFSAVQNNHGAGPGPDAPQAAEPNSH